MFPQSIIGAIKIHGKYITWDWKKNYAQELVWLYGEIKFVNDK